MIYELCSHAASFITDEYETTAWVDRLESGDFGREASLEDQRRKRGEDALKVGTPDIHFPLVPSIYTL